MFSASERRFDFAAHFQGSYLSQSMFEILKFQEPANDNIYFEQSVAFNKRGDYKRGFELLDNAVKLNPQMHLGYRGYMKLRFLRDYEGALKDFNRLDSLTPQVIDTPWGEDIDFLRGESYFGLEEYAEAKKYFKQSIENQGIDWVDIQAFVYLGICEHKSGNIKEAVKYYDQALDQSNYTVEAHLGLAKIYGETGEKEKMELHLDLANKHFVYKRNDSYNEYLNEVYKEDIEALKNRNNI